MIGGQICKDKSLWVHEAYKETVLQKNNSAFIIREIYSLWKFILSQWPFFQNN